MTRATRAQLAATVTELGTTLNDTARRLKAAQGIALKHYRESVKLSTSASAWAIQLGTVATDPRAVVEIAEKLIEACRENADAAGEMTAIEKVLALHTPVLRYSAACNPEHSQAAEEDAWHACASSSPADPVCEVTSFAVCDECGRIEQSYEWHDYEEAIYPCRTVTAIEGEKPPE